MLIRFWGTRGSLPAPLGTAGLRRKLRPSPPRGGGAAASTRDEAIERFVAEELDFATSHTFGGNTACVQIDVGGPEYVLCDLGSGARELGLAAMARYRPGVAQVFHVFLSHLHWDHIQGFPFFVPAYIPGNRIVIHGCHEGLEAGFRRQHGAPSFPVDFSQLPATIEFVRLVPGETYEIAGPPGHAPSASSTPGTPTRTGSSGTARPSSTRRTPSTSSTTPRARAGSPTSSATPIW